jgi:hypothetical protein
LEEFPDKGEIGVTPSIIRIDDQASREKERDKPISEADKAYK